MNKTPFFDTSRLFAWKKVYPNEWQRIVADILATYIDVSRPFYNGSIRLYMEKDAKKLEKMLRDFKSVSGDIGADLLRECLAEMECSARSGELEKVGENLANLNFIYFQTMDEMKDLLSFLKMDGFKNAS